MAKSRAEIVADMELEFDRVLGHLDAVTSMGRMSQNQGLQQAFSSIAKLTNTVNSMQALVKAHEEDRKDLDKVTDLLMYAVKTGQITVPEKSES